MDSQWSGSISLGSWNRWDDSQPSSGCGRADSSTGHLWTNELCSDVSTLAVALCMICEHSSYFSIHIVLARS